MLPDYNIYITTDPAHINQAARMMMETEPWITLGNSFEDCLRSFEGPCKEFYVLETDERLAGFVILQICGSFKGYIQTLCVDQQYRNRGLGREILKFCEERILKISPNIFICVSAFNSGAIKLYQDFGFKKIGELENFVKEGYTEILLRKTVGAMRGFRPR
jgi:[ribosomal protein S18]-alanine N-acetyltransferase